MTLALKSGKIRLDLYGIVIGYVSGVCGGGSARLTISSKFDPPLPPGSSSRGFPAYNVGRRDCARQRQRRRRRRRRWQRRQRRRSDVGHQTKFFFAQAKIKPRGGGERLNAADRRRNVLGAERHFCAIPFFGRLRWGKSRENCRKANLFRTKWNFGLE